MAGNGIQPDITFDEWTPKQVRKPTAPRNGQSGQNQAGSQEEERSWVDTIKDNKIIFIVILIIIIIVIIIIVFMLWKFGVFNSKPNKPTKKPDDTAENMAEPAGGTESANPPEPATPPEPANQIEQPLSKKATQTAPPKVKSHGQLVKSTTKEELSKLKSKLGSQSGVSLDKVDVFPNPIKDEELSKEDMAILDELDK